MLLHKDSDEVLAMSSRSERSLVGRNLANHLLAVTCSSSKDGMSHRLSDMLSAKEVLSHKFRSFGLVRDDGSTFLNCALLLAER